LKTSKDKKKGKKAKFDPIKNPGSLEQFGYHMNLSPQARHKALNKAVRKMGMPVVKRKVRGLVLLFSNKPKYRNIPRNDVKYLEKQKKVN